MSITSRIHRMATILLAVLLLAGATPALARQRAVAAPSQGAITSRLNPMDTFEELLQGAVETAQEIGQGIGEFFEERRDAEPQHAALGEELQATENLAVSVIAVEAGPYDYADDGPTMKVTVAMRNTSDHVVYVKPNNWDADNTWGQRVDHKYFVKDAEGNWSERSFGFVAISPGATYEGVLYFDGEGLVSVVYEPHWLVSAEGEYLYFDVA